jgi:hypothetical protein
MPETSAPGTLVVRGSRVPGLSTAARMGAAPYSATSGADLNAQNFSLISHYCLPARLD